MGFDKITLIYLVIIIMVGISSFGLGRLSVKNEVDDKTSIVVAPIPDLLNKEEKIELKKMYVASKNGKMYYSSGCNGANRIKKENQIWFNTKSDAEKSGYTMSSNCK